MTKLIKVYKLIKDAYNSVEYVSCSSDDEGYIDENRKKLLEAMALLEDIE